MKKNAIKIAIWSLILALLLVGQGSNVASSVETEQVNLCDWDFIEVSY